MELSKKEKTIKYIVFCVLIALAALLQNVGGLWFEIGGARCFFLIPVCIILSLGEDEKISALFGLFAGFLWDTVSAQHMGFNCIFLMLLCYIVSTLETFIFRDTFLIEAAATAIISLLYVIAYWLFFVLRKGVDGSAVIFLEFYLPCFVYTCVMMPVLYLLITPLKNKLNKVQSEN
ncbi:MAG: rod shape-determining protein MreD [Eubacterium sp.]|nr:rod shape-determining protein MreD [Eubacterium sp.]